MEIFIQFIQTITPYAVTGALVSMVVQVVKQYLDKSSHKFLLVIFASLIGGIAFHFIGLIPQSWLIGAAGIWASANTIYLALDQVFNAKTQ